MGKLFINNFFVVSVSLYVMVFIIDIFFRAVTETRNNILNHTSCLAQYILVIINKRGEQIYQLFKRKIKIGLTD